MYFSIVTITTLGYGDYVPIDPWSKFFVSAETVMGVLFIIIVVSTFVSLMGGRHQTKGSSPQKPPDNS